MDEQPFQVHVRPQRERLVIEAHGEIDLATVPRLREAISTAVADGCRDLVVDFRAVTFMDSAAVHLLQDLRAMRTDGIDCRLIDGRPEVGRVCSKTRLPSPSTRVASARQ